MRRLLVMSLLFAGCFSSQPRVVLYCAQDREFAVESLGDFEKSSGRRVDTKFDTEADKSVSLVNELIQDREKPRCDVFWNNEIVSTIRLQKMGLLAPYASPAAKPFPAFARAKDDSWHAFAARARVLVVNTDLVPEAERPRSLLELTDPKWKGKVVMARPVHGTTATQAACVFTVLGADKAKDYYRGLTANGIQLAPGNKQVAEWVSAGRTPSGQPVAVGVTDTDDALGEMEKNSKLAMVFPDRDGLGTLFIPNSVMIIKNGPDPEGARKLVDYLLSPEVEKRLAEGSGHQIPLNPEVKAKLPAGLETPATVKPFLRREFARD
jgi:iron(III) transport system substrate-binding protein